MALAVLSLGAVGATAILLAQTEIADLRDAARKALAFGPRNGGVFPRCFIALLKRHRIYICSWRRLCEVGHIIK